MSVEISVGYTPDGAPVIVDEVPTVGALPVACTGGGRCALVHIGPDRPVWWGNSLAIGVEPVSGGQKLEILDGDGNWQEIGTLSCEAWVDWDQVEGVEDIVVYGGARGGKTTTILLESMMALHAESLAFDMPKLIESRPGKATGKGRKAQNKFNRKLGGGW